MAGAPSKCSAQEVSDSGLGSGRVVARKLHESLAAVVVPVARRAHRVVHFHNYRVPIYEADTSGPL